MKDARRWFFAEAVIDCVPDLLHIADQNRPAVSPLRIGGITAMMAEIKEDHVIPFCTMGPKMAGNRQSPDRCRG